MTVHRPEFVKALASQTYRFSAPEGRPSATPTVGTQDDRGTAITAEADTYVTQDGVNTTIAATAAKGAKSLTVTSATGITVGSEYLAGNHKGQFERAVVASVNSTTIGLVEPLGLDYDVQSTTWGTFASTEWTYTLQTADVSMLREQAVFTYTYAVGGVTYTGRRMFDVVLYPLVSPLTPKALYERVGSDLAHQDPRPGSDFADQRAAAWGVVLDAIRDENSDGTRWRPAMVVDNSELFEYSIAVFTRICHEQGIEVIRVPVTRAELYADEEAARARAFSTLSWLDLEEDEALAEDEAQPLTMDLVR